MPFLTPFLGRGFRASKVDYRKKETLILTSLLEDLVSLLTSTSFTTVARGVAGRRRLFESRRGAGNRKRCPTKGFSPLNNTPKRVAVFMCAVTERRAGQAAAGA